MTLVSVWAPNAKQVVLDCAGTQRPMARRDGGWWRLEADHLVHGVDYGFRVDGDGPFPDPRSAWQPFGVHGPSRWVDHETFAWRDAAWRAPPLSAAVIGELHVGTFTPEGTFDAVIGKLDHLVELGLTHLELMPVQEFPGERGWGYDGVDLFAPHHAYGGPDGLKRLVDACHRRGLAMLLDVVYNHLGPDGNYLGRFGPYFTDAYSTPWGDAVNLDRAHSDEVRRFVIDNALMWLRDYHFDGLRIDAVHAIVDTSAVHLLEALSGEVRRLESRIGRHLALIAESDLNDPRLIRPVESGGYGLDALWNEDFHHALHAALTGESAGYYADFGELGHLAKVLTRGFVHDGTYSRFRKRSYGRPAADVPGRCFVGCLQNHDQVGNRAAGERSSQLLSPGLLKVGAALVLTSPFVPMLFQGEEWAATSPFLYFTDHRDPELAAAVRNGRREEFAAFGWDPETIPDPQSDDSFERSRLDWAEPVQHPHAEILDWHRALIRLRRHHPAFTDDRLDRLRVSVDEQRCCLTLRRPDLILVCNLGKQRQKLHLAADAAHLGLRLASTPGIELRDAAIGLPGESVAILAEMD
ncbi:malto-oligosyltrehalose trehalohydrolase [Thioalkalicoccus limnaeus]|uniref:Malto-oligosyltrehalose trehalohydrolase n=1 Tax=Thioalkalicoccus limnaeus TaxID=120681 RepID=A0ABV4BCG4_9GAMM